MNDDGIRILQAIECSSMVSHWTEYLCLEMRDGRSVLSHRRYDVLAEVSDYAFETDDGDDEYRIPEVIEGKPVVGTEDGYIVGGELTVDPSDSEPEFDLTDADPAKVSAWLTERDFDLSPEIEVAWARTALKVRMPTVQGNDELGEPDEEADAVEPAATVPIASVTQLRIRLLRWMDVSASDENDYPAEVRKNDDGYYYRARGITVSMTEDEAVQVISNPFLYYFSTALKLQNRIDKAKESLSADGGAA